MRRSLAIFICLSGAVALLVQAASAAGPPTAYTGEAAQLTTTSALLQGSVYPANQTTSYYFQYGATAGYGAQTTVAVAGAGTAAIHVAMPLAALAPASAYHVRLIATNPLGTAYGQDRVFTTRKVPLRFTLTTTPGRRVFGEQFVVAGTLSGTGSAAHPVLLQANPFPFLGGFKVVGPAQVTDTAGHFSFLLPGLVTNTQLRVATPDTPPAFSQAVVARVAVRVALHARGTGRRGFLRLSGTVAPGPMAAIVRLQWLRPRDKPFTLDSTLVVGGSGAPSHFSRVVRVRRAGLYRALVIVSGAQVSGHSRAIRIG